MARDPQKLLQRNQDALRRIKVVKEKNPKWRFECVLEDVANEFYISVSTLKKIIKNPNHVGDVVQLSNTGQFAFNFDAA